MNRIRVGIVGAGEVTQQIHLPTLDVLADTFEPVAVCDVSPQVVDAVGERWRIAGRYAEYQDLVRRMDVDAVLVACSEAFHTEVTLAALAAGKHFLLEKPMCYTLHQADAIVEAQRRAARVVQIGYMRRYNPAFLAGCQRVRELLDKGDVRLARVHDVIGANALVVGQIARVTRAGDLPAPLSQAGAEQKAAQIEEAIGTRDPEHQGAFALLHGLASHDLSAMREMLGLPRGVLYAARRQGGRCFTAALDYGDFVCHLEIGVDQLPRFDAHLEVYGSRDVVRVTFNTPYVRSLPVTATITSATPDEHGAGPGVATQQLHPGWADQYALEWRAFAGHIAAGTQPKTSPADARHDVQLILALYAASCAP